VPLKNLGYPVVSLWPRDMDGLIKDFLLLGELFGQRLKAQRLIDDIRQRFHAIANQSLHKSKKRVYLQMWTEPLITVGGASFPNWLVSAAGGVNVFGDLSFDSGQIGLESLIQRNPDVLIFLTEQAPFVKTLANRAGWTSIRGVRASNFCFIDEADIRRSIMFIDGLTKLHRCISGDGESAPRLPTEPK
jgi:ABC-type Fe3+-hydroxamate transport system substrate-binding protein